MVGESLSPREKEVVAHLMQGARVKTIATRLSISADTVRSHLKSVFSKLGVHGQAELVELLTQTPDLLESRLAAASHPRPGVDEFRDANRRLAEEVRNATVGQTTAEAIGAGLRAALPLKAQQRRDWGMRFGFWGSETPSSVPYEARLEELDGLVEMGAALIDARQQTPGEAVDARGAVYSMLEPVVATAAVLLFDERPSSFSRQIAFLESEIAKILEGGHAQIP